MLKSARTGMGRTNTVAFGNLHAPNVTDLLPGIICFAVGMIIGTIIGAIKTKKVN